MSIVTRKERDKEELRSLILKTALDLFVEKGYNSMSIRAIAERIEYSPTTIYLYFKDKDDLFYHVHQEGFQIMKDMFMPLLLVADPFERLIELGRAYLKFAQQNPKLYHLMFIDDSVANALCAKDLDWKEGDETFGFLHSNVKQCMQMGYMPQADTEVTSYFIWCSLHGIISLALTPARLHMLSEPIRDNILQLAFAMFENQLHLLKPTQAATNHPTV